MATDLPASLKRISVQRQSTLDFSLPPFPPLPDSMRNRFPELKVWEGRMDEWRRATEGMIREVTTPQREDPEG